MKKTLSIVALVALFSLNALAVQNEIRISGYLGGGAIVSFGEEITDDIVDGEMYFQGWDFDLGDLEEYTGTDRYIYTKSSLGGGISMTIDSYNGGAMISENGGYIPVTYYFDGYDAGHVWTLGTEKQLTSAPSGGENSDHFFSFQRGDISGQPPGSYEAYLYTTISAN